MGSSSQFLKDFTSLLESYGGRDTLLEALCYGAKLVAGFQANRNPELARRCDTASSKISGAIATLRLIDDLPQIQYTLDYGLGRDEPDRITAVLGVMSNAVDLLFYPIETVCWLAEHKIVDVKSRSAWAYLNSIFSVLSAYLSFVRTMRRLSLSREKLNRKDVVSITRLVLDCIHAVNTLPRGNLWGGRLSTLQVGAIGTLSAGLGIYQIVSSRKSRV
ncbi:uncharacterized protein Dana_GF12123 [Drosophila ananassae]|uniref:Peroxisomal membrane protein 11C n=1 Tax=Drosophila ananassae TaxID=7217 RepID=B3MBT6_DROAN|nr:peroxisomal membrane protein 11C [Drosophila ananassae]EDV36107.1 uncharacterized protein Dana_GF12123 [Drosophila ananassae]